MMQAPHRSGSKPCLVADFGGSADLPELSFSSKPHGPVAVQARLPDLGMVVMQQAKTQGGAGGVAAGGTAAGVMNRLLARPKREPQRQRTCL